MFGGPDRWEDLEHRKTEQIPRGASGAGGAHGRGDRPAARVAVGCELRGDGHAGRRPSVCRAEVDVGKRPDVTMQEAEEFKRLKL